jgi:uncharacterized protein (DUF58 family)
MLPKTLIDRLRYLEIATSRAVRAHRAGDYLSRIRGRSFEFDQHKPYQPGDDYRQIDWNVTARMQVPFVKRELEEKELSGVIIADLSGSMQFTSTGQTKKELLLEVAATLAFSAVTDHIKIGLLACTDRVELYIPPKRGRSQVWKILEGLWDCQPRGHATCLDPALEMLASRLKQISLVFCLSDLVGVESVWSTPYLRTLAHKIDFVPVILEDAWEEAIPESRGALRLRDAETKRELLLTLSPRRCRRYRAVLAERSQEIRARLYSLNLDHVLLRTGEDHLNRLIAFFVGRKRKRS